MIIYALLTTAILAGLLGIALTNARAFPRLAANAPPEEQRVSVLVPARNEAASIGATVSDLLSQTYVNLEVLVLDDDSCDGTGDAARRAGAGDPRLRVLSGAPLPAGWSGKPWACYQLATAAAGSLLLFTDADVRWARDAVAAVVAARAQQEADLLTVWPTQATVTWSERVVVPLMALSVLAYLPLRLAEDPAYPQAAAANGQCLLFTRHAYVAVGGHRAVAGSVLDDVELARAVKHAGLRLGMADAHGLIRCRMYRTWPQVRDGFAKNILAGHANSRPLLLLSTVLHLAIFVGPWLWLGWGLVAPAVPGWPWWPLLLAGLGVAVRGVTAAATGQRRRDALSMPLAALLMTRIALQALWWRVRYGGPRWKERTVAAHLPAAAPADHQAQHHG